MRYSLFAGGKRLRPTLVLAAADAVATSSSPATGRGDPATAESLALPAACAIEFIHTYSLIHDDLPAMDDDTLRRGRATLHVVYGDGLAILAADGLQAEAFALVAREPATDDPAVLRRKLRAIRLIGDAAGAAGMVGGQAVDLQASGQTPGDRLTLDADGVRRMHAMKTGALIRASAVVGALMAGAPDAVLDVVDRFASEIGLAFQIVDDILDVEGATDDLGKSAGKDAAHAKPTYPALYGVERSRALAAECVSRARQALADASMSGGDLAEIADWVVQRRH